MPSVRYRDKNIEYTLRGNGRPVVFLHGYLESSIIWEEFVKSFDSQYRIICIDLPGHGRSEIISPIHTMQLMAEATNAVLEAEKIEKATIVGHSMGGYVALEFYNLYPNKVTSLCFLHSTPFADDEARKQYRSQVIEMIKAGKHILLAKEHVEKTFAPYNLDKFTQQIGFLKVIAVNTKAEGAIAALEGMKLRTDYSNLISTIDIDFLWILGSDDNFIPANISDKLPLSSKVRVVKIEGAGHQGYIEKSDEVKQHLKSFLETK